MDRSKIQRIIEKLDDINKNFTDDEFNLALYIYVRFGVHQFNNYICDDELEQINEVLKRHNTLFNEDINDYAELILNDDESCEG